MIVNTPVQASPLLAPSICVYMFRITRSIELQTSHSSRPKRISNSTATTAAQPSYQYTTNSVTSSSQYITNKWVEFYMVLTYESYKHEHNVCYHNKCTSIYINVHKAAEMASAARDIWWTGDSYSVFVIQTSNSSLYCIHQVGRQNTHSTRWTYWIYMSTSCFWYAANCVCILAHIKFCIASMLCVFASPQTLSS